MNKIFHAQNRAIFVSAPIIETIAATGISFTEADLNGELKNAGTLGVNQIGLLISLDPTPTLQNNLNTLPNGDINVGQFTINSTQLQDNTTYYFRAYATNVMGNYYGEVLSFTTLEIIRPTITTNSVTEVLYSSAVCGGNISDSGSGTILERGICFSKNDSPTINDSIIVDGSVSLGSFSLNITALDHTTLYYVRAYVITSFGEYYGNERDFTTDNLLPYIRTSELTNISSYTADTGGYNIDGKGFPILERGMCWGANAFLPTKENEYSIDANTGTADFLTFLTNLLPGVLYYVRAYATSVNGIGYGNMLILETIALNTPLVDTIGAITVTDSSFTMVGDIASDNGFTILEKGFDFSIDGVNFTESVAVGVELGQTLVTPTGLEGGQLYYYRCYAKNSIGKGVGEIMSVRTLEPPAAVIPTVTTNEVGVIVDTSASCGGNVTSNGGDAVTDRGIVYSTSQNPTTSDSIVTSGSGLGSFDSVLDNLTPSTTYYIRAYAINSVGTSYGIDRTVTTLAVQTYLPTVTTAEISAITQVSASTGGDVTDDGGETVSERGIVYSTISGPTTSSSKIISGSGLGVFSIDMLELLSQTIYYVRAYAINANGTSYGSQISFTTLEIETFEPTVSTDSVSLITQIEAQVDGTVSDDGGKEVTERGIVYSTSQNPTLVNSKVNSGSGEGSFAVALSGLIANTLYYVRAYAININGTSYGSQISFTTLAIPTENPTVITSSISDITETTANSGGNVTDDGGETVTERGIVYSTSQNPTTSSSKVTSGSGIGSFTASMSGLTLDTTYYVRAYAINANGTSYGLQESFSTLEATLAADVFVYNWNARVHPNMIPAGWDSATESNYELYNLYLYNYGYSGMVSNLGSAKTRSSNGEVNVSVDFVFLMTDSSHPIRPEEAYVAYCYEPLDVFKRGNQNKKNGMPLLLIKDDSIDPGSITDYDGNVYPTIKLGDSVFTINPWKCTHLTDGTPIDYVISNNEWVETDQPAMCGINDENEKIV